MKQKIALMGVSGAGKDYLASYLIKTYQFHRFSFSDQLKKLAHLIYPWLDTNYPPHVKEEPLNIQLTSGEIIDKSPRQIWLHLNHLRDIEQQIFIRMLAEEISQSNTSDQIQHILISDIRSSEELLWCQRNGFQVVYIENANPIYQSYEIDSPILKNKTKADFTFINNHNGLAEFEAFYQSKITPSKEKT